MFMKIHRNALLICIPVVVIVFIFIGQTKQNYVKTKEILPQFIQADFIDLEKVASISKFRSGSGHDFSKGSGETCRSMKHYYNLFRPEEIEKWINQNHGLPPKPDGKTDILIFSPVDGKIVSIESERTDFGEQIYLRPKANPDFMVRLFHIYPLSSMKKGSIVKAGENIGVISQYQNTDIAIMKNWNTFISYFEVMPDSLFMNYQKFGIKNRSEFIISKAERDANPFECNGEYFTELYDRDPRFENFIFLKK
ncbi:hypothetical protein A3C09_00780 [Candidatus Uhrbacteria bacterium RIFCSPHIGHO2_02_FULL_47_44]|uniref:Uncharacterized protein n=1 Tax=Candidatus Uhrbacteria bacterium RIFCSPLOWO2_02_FULL_48_18 TaxID=1802408 RepID=A0A1F7VC67_9BACT|nr:MAG: hypothetical protein A2839_05215 [Candidatus Uhrbacteria bacterium RIFCSPHIGHO2_01_FULL_47_10]OGL71489.1 MAG: hypothetical protein A3C09_00780 [Candidatus Uhrbacteria bacterium RIFCSPHIGHO2_02_FULL_47_44]OGL77668.1 MAG: hypothetical protein A3E97_04005 [Candidatus Uhrbacteria bacterium RIFCSPHIGHO2_12_FULL_47_12]OGL82399.1 MAG: hypothetical protein A3B20_01440 [Candidatus Uhrbacteria bacterium RIFCSPLOWO2_01_FULL_47_17]OGL88045.1 MAG: hypothetical protein A3I41_02970 [Candidatus Uhrbact